MQLPEFITNAITRFQSIEAALGKLTAAEAQLVTVTARAAQLESDLLTARQTIQTTQASLDKVTAELATTKTALTAAEATIADPKGEIQRLAAVKANEIATKMGAPPIKAEDHTLAASGGKTVLEQYLALNQTDPQAAAQFAAKHGGAMGMVNGK